MQHENACGNWTCQLGLKLSNVTVFSGWDDNGMLEDDPHREFDFLIVGGLSKTIVHIEVKHSNKENNKAFNKAIQQVINSIVSSGKYHCINLQTKGCSCKKIFF